MLADVPASPVPVPLMISTLMRVGGLLSTVPRLTIDGGRFSSPMSFFSVTRQPIVIVAEPARQRTARMAVR
jgi:hypothetical protein